MYNKKCLEIFPVETNFVRMPIVFGRKEKTMYYTSGMVAMTIITLYVCLAAIMRHSYLGDMRFVRPIFAGRTIASVIVGALLGVLISAPFFQNSLESGYIAMGATIALVVILFSQRILAGINRPIPQWFRNGVRIGPRILQYVLIAAAIIVVVVVVMNYAGV